MRRTVLAQPFGDNIDVLEERSDEVEELRASGRKREWTPLEKLRAE
ncbi:MAG: hypothetical protein ACJ8LV_03915 [Chthoniobacterales bacterium]